MEPIEQQEIKKKTFWQGLLEFLKEHSVIGLAIGVITAQISKDLIDSIVKGIFTPIIQLIIPGALTGFTFHIGQSVFDLGIIINAGLTFVIVLTFLYIIIKQILKKDYLDKK